MYRRLFQYIKPFKTRVAALLIIMLVLSALTVAEPATLGLLTDALFYPRYGISLQSFGIELPDAIKQESGVDGQAIIAPIEDTKLLSAKEKQVILKVFKDSRVEIEQVIDGDSKLNISYRLPEGLDNDVKFLEEISRQIAEQGIKVKLAKVVEPSTHMGQGILKQVPTIFIIPILLILLQFIRGIFMYAQYYLATSMSQKVIMRLRNELYAHLQRLSIGFFEDKSTGQLMSRVTNDVGMIQNLFSNILVELIVEPFIIIWGIIYCYLLNPYLSTFLLIVIPLIMLPINKFSKKMRKIGKEVQQKTGEITAHLQETLSAIRVVKAFAMEQYEIKRFGERNRENYRIYMNGARLQGLLTPTIELFAVTALCLLVLIGGRAVHYNQMNPKDLITFVLIIGYISNPVKRITKLIGQIQHSLAAAERIFSLLDEQPSVQEPSDPIILPKLNGEIEFKNVCFNYGQPPDVLKDINLRVEPGQIIALVGPSGAGKSSLVNLLPRFYDPYHGEVLVDGINIKEVDLVSLRSQMGIVPQESILFRGTISDNIAYGRLDADPEAIEQAAKAANAHQFILDLPDGYQTMVGERGVTLSGGQRQRIAIARALLRDPRILILDEATSALDTTSEVLVQEALERLMQNRTTFVIAHRLSTIQKADLIVVLDKGEIVESGTHEQLLQKRGLYARLYRQQFRKNAPSDED